MKYFIVLSALLYYIVHGQNVYDNQDKDNELDSDFNFIKNIKKRPNNRMGFQDRKSYFSYHEPNFDMQDYNHETSGQSDARLQMILRKLNELLWYVKKTRVPQAQIIYIPYSVLYPVLYPVPQIVPYHEDASPPKMAKLNDDLDAADSIKDDVNNDWDGFRPVSFDAIAPEESVPNPPPVEHGSIQAGMEATSQEAVVRLGTPSPVSERSI